MTGQGPSTRRKKAPGGVKSGRRGRGERSSIATSPASPAPQAHRKAANRDHHSATRKSGQPHTPGAGRRRARIRLVEPRPTPAVKARPKLPQRGRRGADPPAGQNVPLFPRTFLCPRSFHSLGLRRAQRFRPPEQDLLGGNAVLMTHRLSPLPPIRPGDCGSRYIEHWHDSRFAEAGCPAGRHSLPAQCHRL